MAFELQQGDECRISSDFLCKGEPAFSRGDIVTIEGISPDRNQPGNKYVVHSSMLERAVRVPGAILIRTSCPRCGQRLGEARPGKFASCVCGWSDRESGGAGHLRKASGVKTDPEGRAAAANGKPRIAYVMKEIHVDGLVAFREGDYVKVEGESPDPVDPDRKYVVTSRLLGSRMLLSDEDIKF